MYNYEQMGALCNATILYQDEDDIKRCPIGPVKRKMEDLVRKCKGACRGELLIAQRRCRENFNFHALLQDNIKEAWQKITDHQKKAVVDVSSLFYNHLEKEDAFINNELFFFYTSQITDLANRFSCDILTLVSLMRFSGVSRKL